ncbi:MAG: nuclear transport factor 2 family protein [Acidobacteria bacterium]|nr:nuclear transport factor 2 family protein [Acidobacteriota bacterium]
MIGRAQLGQVEHDEEFHEKILGQHHADERMLRLVVDEIDNACDAKDWEKCRAFFADEVTVDFTSLAGGEPATIPADALVDAWRTNLYAEKKSYHQRGNHRFEIDGDRAVVFSKAYAFNLLETGAVTGLWEVWGNYTHRLQKIDGDWRCTGLILEVVHQRGDDRVRTYLPES